MEGRFNIFTSCLVLLFTSTTLALSSQEFNANGWEHFREIHIPAEINEGLVGIPLESEVLEKCRPDLADIRVVSSGGKAVPIFITEASDGGDAPPFPVQFRVIKRPGKFTEIWIDKKAKERTRAVTIQTSSKEFVRKVELRGSDTARESYVVRVDGLIADFAKPESFQSLEIEHRENNFQYMQLRILDEDQPPLKIENILCTPANTGVNLTKRLEPRMTEKDVTESNTIEFDLGRKRFPLTSIRISSKTKEFMRKIRIAGRSSVNGDIWKDFYEGTIFRIRKEDAIKEKLRAQFKPQPYRYVKLELAGSSPTVNVDKIEAFGAVRMAVFEYRKNLTYHIYYGNGQTKSQSDTAPAVTNLGQIAALSSEIKLGGELKVPEAPVVVVEEAAQSENGSTQSFLRKFTGIALLLLGLLILFVVMLKTRSLRRPVVGRHSHLLSSRDQFKISLREH